MLWRCSLFLLLLIANLIASAQDVMKIADVKWTGEEAKTRVVVRGVVTYLVSDRNWLFMQDDSGGLLITMASERPAIGQEITASGVVAKGAYAPFIENAAVTVHGKAALPEPLPASLAEVVRNGKFARRVQTDAWVTDVVKFVDTNLPAQKLTRVLLRVVAADTQSVAAIESDCEAVDPAQWLHCKVRLTGLNWVSGLPAIRPLTPAEVEVLTPAPEKPWLVTTGNRWPQETGEPLRTTMSVTVLGLVVDGTWAARCGNHSLRISPLQPLDRRNAVAGPTWRAWPELKPGDQVQVSGLLLHRLTVWNLMDAVIEQPVLRGTAPEPVRAEPASILNDEHWWDLVTINGRLVGEDTVNTHNRLMDQFTFEQEGVRFLTFVPRAGAKGRPQFSHDHLYRVTGLCTTANQIPRPKIFYLWTDAAQIEQLGLTAQAQTVRWRNGLFIALVALTGIGGWLVALRARVRQQRQDQLAMAALNTSLEQRVVERTAALRAAEEELRKALAAERELSKLKTNFVSMVSHEFRTPLGIISVSSELLSRYRDRLKPEQTTEHLASITNAVRRMTGMMENILVLSRVDTERLECKPVPMNLPSLMRRLVDEIRSSTDSLHEIRLAIKGDNVEADARVDEAVLRHVMSNLISNACKYSPQDRPVDVQLRRDGADAVITVRDSGIGIPEADRGRLFESFHRAGNVGQVSGTGLGLVIVKRCVDLHQGSITVESEEGHGTLFTVRIGVW